MIADLAPATDHMRDDRPPGPRETGAGRLAHGGDERGDVSRQALPVELLIALLRSAIG